MPRPDDVRSGAFAEYMLSPASSLFHKPANLTFDAACLTEPLSGAWKGVIQHSQIEVISHRFPLSRIHEAMEVMGSQPRTKVVIKP